MIILTNRTDLAIEEYNESINYPVDRIINGMRLRKCIINKEDSKRFNELINEELTEFEKQVYDLRINGFSHGEICKLLNKTPKSIEAVLYRIRVKLRNILDKIN